MPQPAEADAPTNQFARNARSNQIDPADDFVTGHARTKQIGHFAIDNVQIRTADRASLDLDPQLSRGRCGIGARLLDERAARGVQNHRLHGILPLCALKNLPG